MGEQDREYDITDEQIELIKESANTECPCQELAQSILKVIGEEDGK